MSDEQSTQPGGYGGPPPPGSAPPPSPGTPYGQQPGGYGSAPPPPGWAAPVAKPGVVPLRHLTLGDILGGAFQTIRRNPVASIGLAFAVSAVFMALPLLGSIVYGAADLGGPGSAELTDLGGVDSTVFTVLSYSGSVLSIFAATVITGLMTRVVGSAVVGRPMRAGEAWTRTRGRLWALVGLTLLSILVSVAILGLPVGLGVGIGFAADSVGLAIGLGIVLGLLGLVALVFVWTRYLLLAAPALVLEDLGIRASLRRAGELSRGQFWRLLGIGILAQLLAGVAAQIIAVPLGIVGGIALFVIGGSWGGAVLLLATNLATLISAALVGPFIAGVTTLQYVDQRFRKEGLDLTLLERSLGDRTA